MELKGRLVVITGSAQGLGRAFARRILQDGARVCLSDIQDSAGLVAKAELQEIFGKDSVHFVRCDVTKPEEVAALYDEAESHFGDKVDIWCNNAGINGIQAGWRKCIEVDIVAVMAGTYYAMDRMSKAKGGRGGLIVNTASVAGIVFNQPQDREASDANSYFVAKHGVVALTKMLANPQIEAETGVRVVCLCPTFADTNIIREGMQDRVQQVREKIEKYQTIMTPEYVAEAFHSLITSCANGSSLLVVEQDVPFFTMPDLTLVMTVALSLGARLFRVRVFQWYHQAVYLLLVLLLIHFAIGFLLSLIF